MSGFSNYLGLVGVASALAGHDREARGVLAELEVRRERGQRTAMSALVMAALGEMDDCFARLEQAVEERSPILVAMVGNNPTSSPMIADMVADPRFHALVRRLNFPETVASVPPSDSSTSA